MAGQVRKAMAAWAAAALWLGGAAAQSVGLPAPRLLNVTPMGGQAGTAFEVAIAGEHLDDAGALVFSDPRIAATPKPGPDGKPLAGKYVVKIAADCPAGLHEARIATRLGISSSRVFAVGTLRETSPAKPNRTLADAWPLPMNSVCNGTVADRAIDYYSFEAKQGQRIVVDGAARGIDSKLNATIAIADAAGRDLLVERRGGALDFAVPRDGKYMIKVHELTYKGGPAYYYRLGLWELPPGAPLVRQPGTQAVNAFSWPPPGLPARAPVAEAEPNGNGAKAQRITLPCDVAGRFFPAADVDVFEFAGKKGDEWWIEVASERLGLPTDPAILVQRIALEPNGAENPQDALELSDVPSPVKVSSNGYAYDGPPYNAGTADPLGKLTLPYDGVYRMQLSDLFGGTRSVPSHEYRLVIRKAAPDFALVAWALHMELRNGDRNALSKPLALRRGATMALEVVAYRRDGFDGPIELAMSGLPAGVTATGLSIPAGKSYGMMLVTAAADAPAGFANAKFVGRASLAGQPAERPCRFASVSWPIPDSSAEIPAPRLVADLPVSVCAGETAPLAIAPTNCVVEAVAGTKIAVPLTLRRTAEFSGDRLRLKPLGAGFERMPAFDVLVNNPAAEATLDLKALNLPPGEHRLAFVGGAVVKHRHRPELAALAAAEATKKQAELQALEAAAKQAEAAARNAPPPKKSEMAKAAAAMTVKMKAAADTVAAAQRQAQAAQAAAQPKDIADIVVCEPITVRIKPAEKK